MRLAKLNCKHCGRPYTALLSYSGYKPSVDQYDAGSDSEHCSKCALAIRRALARIPITHKLDFVPTELTAEDWEKEKSKLEEQSKVRNNGLNLILPISRLLPGAALAQAGNLYLNRTTGKVYREEYVPVNKFPMDRSLYEMPTVKREDTQGHKLTPMDDAIYFMKYYYDKRTPEQYNENISKDSV